MSVASAMVVITPTDTSKLRFDALYRQTAPDVYAYVASLLRDRAAAEDVTAQAFERAYRRQRTFNPRRGEARAWIFGIARNAALDELRRRKRRAALVVDPEDPLAQNAFEVRDDDQDARRLTVGIALNELDPRDRELILLKFHSGLSNAQIAAVLKTSESNAGTRLHRAITRLREACNAPA